jgi:hypothetical protein
MWPLEMIPEDIIEINYSGSDFPSSFRAFKPILFKSGQLYCCLLGPNMLEGIFAMGFTVDAVISQWNVEFKKRLIEEDSKDDPTTRFVSYKIKMNNRMQIY